MLKIENLSVSYGEHLVLDRLNLNFAANEIHGVLGMNGAGKTTLFNAMYGFLPRETGECLLNEEVLINKNIAFLETRNYFYPFMNGREYLQLLALSNPDFDIDEWNALFELPLNRLIDQYSTGMKKKLAFLGILALNRPVIILDEPFNGVDIESNEKIYQILERIKDTGKIILLSSHIISSLTGICDRISFLSEKKIIKTYGKEDYPLLEKMIQELVRNKIDPLLDQLLKK